MHESTVSRVTSNKYAQTPRALRAQVLLQQRHRARGGESMASVSVQDLLQKIVAAEDPLRPLSDLEIVRRLHEEHGLDIARRTVAKYARSCVFPPQTGAGASTEGAGVAALNFLPGVLISQQGGDDHGISITITGHTSRSPSRSETT